MKTLGNYYLIAEAFEGNQKDRELVRLFDFLRKAVKEEDFRTEAKEKWSRNRK